MRTLIALVLVIACAVSAPAALASGNDVDPELVGTWRVSGLTYPGVNQVTVRVASDASLNQPSGSMRFSAAGGKTNCRARLTYLGVGGDFIDGTFAVRYTRRYSRKAAYFCRPTRRGDRLTLSHWSRGSEGVLGAFTHRGGWWRLDMQ